MAIEHDLASLDLFAGCKHSALSRLSSALVTQDHQPGDALIRQGERGTWFVIVLDGQLEVSRVERTGSHVLATVAPGSILGELSMLTGQPRQATVTAVTAVRAACGGADAFELLLDMPVVHERLTDVAAQRLAANAAPVPVTLRKGTRVVLRPLLPADRDRVAAVLATESPESLRRRFFTPGLPGPRVIDYLVNINYVDHFAWGVAAEGGSRGVGAARYVRLPDNPECANVAFNVVDEYQGRGLGTLLLGALAAAATSAGITRFVGEMLYENTPMRAVLDKAGATWRHLEPGVVAASLDVAAAEAMVDEPLRGELARTARDVVTAAGLALTHRPGAPSWVRGV